MWKLLLVISWVLFASFGTLKGQENRTFSDDFLFGIGTSAYQTEGAWNEDGKGENIWDFWIHNTSFSDIKNNDTADRACDSYHNPYRDSLLAGVVLGVNHYQFSISWSRILPKGVEAEINLKGIEYYQTLIQEIITQGMIPVATLYHNDLPQPLQDIGGWTNPELVKYFTNYARVAFENFAGVGYWLTFNDPKSVCRLGYGEGIYAPGIALDGTAEYLCAYTVIKSHAAAYHLYKEEFSNLTAKVSIAINLDYSEPANSSFIGDIEAAERRNLFEFGLYANPILKGNWPQVVIDRVEDRSKNENFSRSRLPPFTEEEIDYINGTYDFVAVNLFTSHLVAEIDEPSYDDPGYLKDIRVELSVDPHWDIARNGDPVVPAGARRALVWLQETYNDPEIFITGNGVSDDGTATDDFRIAYYRDYLSAILDAIIEYDVKVFGYTAWSFLDGFEWSEGYSQHYGFFYVTFTSDTTSSISRKKSSIFYKEVTFTHRIPGEIRPNPAKHTTT